MTLLKVTSMHRNCTWHTQTWQPPVATLKKWGNLYRKLPEQTLPPHPWQKQVYMPASKLSTGLENGLPMIRLLRFYPWAGNWMEFFWGHCYMKEGLHLGKNQILLARKKLGVGEVWGSIWCVQPTVSDKITHDSDAYWISSHLSLTCFISSGNRVVRG